MARMALTLSIQCRFSAVPPLQVQLKQGKELLLSRLSDRRVPFVIPLSGVYDLQNLVSGSKYLIKRHVEAQVQRLLGSVASDRASDEL